ncbi:hypothetical protein KUCAC02_006183, partial [Chaenocephalus aceratus]
MAAAAQQHLSGGDSLILQEIRNGNQALSNQRARPVLIRLLKCQDRDKILCIAAQRSRENKGPIKYDGLPSVSRAALCPLGCPLSPGLPS